MPSPNHSHDPHTHAHTRTDSTSVGVTAYVYVCTCMCACMHVCVNICMCVCMYVCVCVCVGGVGGVGVTAPAPSPPAVRPSVPFESLAEQRMRARQERRPFKPSNRPPSLSLRAASVDALLIATQAQQQADKATAGSPTAPRAPPMGAAAAAEAGAGAGGATVTPLRTRAKSTHNFDSPTAATATATAAPVPTPADGAHNTVAEASEVRRRLQLAKRASASELASVAAGGTARGPNDGQARAPTCTVTERVIQVGG
jgi:hypothetical protein